MCKPKPFPRCSSHARTQLAKATARLDEAEAEVMDGVATDSVKLNRAREMYARALEDYDTCPENIKKIKAKVEALEEAGRGDSREAENVRRSLQNAQARREQLLHNGDLAAEAQRRLEEKKDEIEALEARANRDLTPEVLSTEEASLGMEQARERLTETSTVIARQYVEQGNTTYAWNPGLWSLDHETDDGERTPEYQAYVDAQGDVAATERAYEAARQTEGHAKLQLALDKMRLKARTGEIASDLHSGNTYEAYGASMINPDGTTNARYLTTIPGTNTPYYAKVLRVRGGDAILETGQRLRLSQARQSDWKYTFPEEGATRGPELYRMDSSD